MTKTSPIFLVFLLVIYWSHASSDFYRDIVGDSFYNVPPLDDDLYRYLPADSNNNFDTDETVPFSVQESAKIRDPELLQQNAGSSLMGKFQYTSGGAGEGKQHLTPGGTENNVQEVKSDNALPFYCHPPNPCPKGFTEKDGCQVNIADTAEEQRAWIEGMQSRGLCSCDAEHMFQCKSSVFDNSPVKNIKLSSPLDSLLDSLLEQTDKQVDNSYVNKGHKRGSLIAERSPTVFKRSVSNKEEVYLGVQYLSQHHNLYLAAVPLVQKRDPNI